MTAVSFMYADSCYFIYMPLFYFYADSRPGTEKSFILCLFDLCRKPYLKLKLPVSFQVVQESFSCPCLQLQGLGFSELPELIFGFIFMFGFSDLSGTVFVVFCMCGPVWTTCFCCFCVPVCQYLDVCAY